MRMGRSNKEIADDLGVGEQAVKALVSRLLMKFGVPNRTTLASEADRALHPSGMTQGLRDALSRSRDLRDQNRELMSAMRRELRGFRELRTKIRRQGNGGNGRRET